MNSSRQLTHPSSERSTSRSISTSRSTSISDVKRPAGGVLIQAAAFHRAASSSSRRPTASSSMRCTTSAIYAKRLMLRASHVAAASTARPDACPPRHDHEQEFSRPRATAPACTFGSVVVPRNACIVSEASEFVVTGSLFVGPRSGQRRRGNGRTPPCRPSSNRPALAGQVSQGPQRNCHQEQCWEVHEGNVEPCAQVKRPERVGQKPGPDPAHRCAVSPRQA